MLCLKRKESQVTVIELEDGTKCRVFVNECGSGFVRLGFEFPKAVRIYREELEPESTVGLGEFMAQRDTTHRPDCQRPKIVVKR